MNATPDRPDRPDTPSGAPRRGERGERAGAGSRGRHPAGRRLARGQAAGLRARLGAEPGIATAEYTLVTLVAATVALLLLNWASGGAVEEFFEMIFDRIVAMFTDSDS